MATVDSKQSKEARAARLRASHGTKNFVSAAARSPEGTRAGDRAGRKVYEMS